MKLKTLNLLAALLLVSASHPVFAMNESACRGGYSIMLLTQNECKTWISSRSSLERRGDNTALKQLDENMRSLMAGRAETCPCAWDSALKEKMLQKNAGF